MVKIIEKDFKIIIEDIVSVIHKTQLDIFQNANTSVLELYFYIGKIVDDKIEWGNKFVDELSIELKIKFLRQTGCSYVKLCN